MKEIVALIIAIALLLQTPLALAMDSGSVVKMSSKSKVSSQLAGDTIVSTKAIVINNARVEGSVRQLLGENTTIAGTTITSDLIVPGSPSVKLANVGSYNGTIEGSGQLTPSNYIINVSNNTNLRHVVTRTDAIEIEAVEAVALPVGTKDLVVKKASDVVGVDFKQVRNIVLQSNVGDITIPAGTYGALQASSNSAFVFGNSGQSAHLIYNVQSLTLNGNTQLKVISPVEVNVATKVQVASNSQVGEPSSPLLLEIKAIGEIIISSNSNVSGVIKSPLSKVIINSNAIVKGAIVGNEVILGSNALVQGLVSDTQAPQVSIDEPLEGEVVSQEMVEVRGSFVDESVVVSVKVNGVTATINSTNFRATIPLNIGTNTIEVIAKDIFGQEGRLTRIINRSDGSNSAPIVNAGQDQIITLPNNIVTLQGSVTDDGKPTNTITITWSKVSGAGNVSFTNVDTAITSAVFSSVGTYLLELKASDGQLESTDQVQVQVNEALSSFELVASPSSTTTVQNGSAVVVISASSDDSNFRNLISLSLVNAPTVIRASFNPAQIAVGTSSTLTLDLNNTGLAAGTYNFKVVGTTQVNSTTLVKEINLTLIVQAAGQTTLSGRVLSTDDFPIPGVTVSMDGRTATTNSAGAFMLVGVLAGVDRAVMVDGRSATVAARTYPVITEPATILAGQANQMPYTFYLPAIDVQYEVLIGLGRENVITTPRVDGLKTVIPPDAVLINRDGTPVTHVSMTPVEIDRTPAPLPSNVATTLVFTNQPGAARSTVAMPVTYPNTAGADPGTRLELYNFNHDTVKWEIYGYGKVSSDAKVIEPEIDPVTSRQYGLKDFSWHFVNFTNVSTNPVICCPANRTSHSVYLPVGYKMESHTDIAITSSRASLVFSRIYTGAIKATPYRLGLGWRDNYEISLSGTFNENGAGRVIWPQQRDGWLFSYEGRESDGSLVFSSRQSREILGDKLRKKVDGSYEYRYKTGELMKFNSSGVLTELVDRNGNTTSLSYTSGKLTTVTDSVGRSLTLEYNAQGLISKVTDPLGRQWQYQYTVNGVLNKVVDPLGQAQQYDYSQGFTLLNSIKDKRGNVIKLITYDDSRRVISQQFADGGIETYQYTFSGEVVSQVTITDPMQRVTIKRFNAAGYVIGEVDPLGQSSTITLDLNTNLAVETKGPCGCTETIKEYDERGNVTKITDELGQVMRYEYEPNFNMLIKVIDRLDRTSTYTYDSKGNRLTMTNALGEVTRWSYDQFGQMVSMTDALNHTWTTTYDVQGNAIAKTDPLANRSTMEYDAIGRMTASVDALSRRNEMSYDAMNRVISRKDSAGAVTTFVYDNNGNQVGLTDALNRTWTSVYDAKDRMISRTDPLNRTTQMFYNRSDELIEVISPLGRSTKYSYDARGQRLSLTEPIGGVVRYVYDKDRNLVSITDQRNSTTSFTYDELDRVIKTTDPLGKNTLMQYDSENNVVSTTNRMSRTTSITYDNLNRPTRVQYLDAVVTYQYDAAGRRSRVDDTQFGATFIAWNYDNANRLLSETTPQGVVNYTYNNASERSSMTALDRAPVNYTYDPAGRLSTISQALNPTLGLETFTYSYDILSRRTRLQRPNQVDTTYEYDQVNRLSRLKHQKGNDPAIEDFQYSYNLDDEISSISSLYSTPLIPMQDIVASSANAANRVTQFGNATYQFNNVGETISKTDSSGTTQYQWDHRGRLISVTLPNNQQVSYKYDAMGRRISSAANGQSIAFVYDLQDIVIDINSNNTKTDYINGMSIDEKLRQFNISNNALYFVHDHLNSTIALTSSSGSVAERLNYEAFGNSTSRAFTRYGYTGREKDDTTGLIHYRARWYDSKQGRFLNEDPIGFDEGPNLYVYVTNNPLLYIDPYGLQSLNPNLTNPFGLNPFLGGAFYKQLPRCTKDVLEDLGFLSYIMDRVIITPYVTPFPVDSTVEAATLGYTIGFTKGNYKPCTKEGIALIAHELVHVRQYKINGTISRTDFIAQYLWDYFSNFSSPDPYRNIPYEKDAYRVQRGVLKELERKYPNSNPCSCDCE